MPPGRRIAEKLRRLFAEMPEGVRSELVRQIEKAQLRGQHDPVHGMILEAARAAFRDQASGPGRLASPMRRLCIPLEPFLSDHVPATKQAGRVSRASLTPVWTWLNRDVSPAVVPALSGEIVKALVDDDDESRAQALAATLVDEAARSTLPLVAAARADGERRRRMIGQVGSERVYADAVDIALILSNRQRIEAFLARLPRRLGAIEPEAAGLLLKAVDRFANGDADLIAIGLAGLQTRLSDPIHLLALAKHAAGTDDAAKFVGNRHAAAADLALFCVDEAVQALLAELKRKDDAERAIACLRRYHMLARGFVTSIDLTGKSPWRRRMSDLRKSASLAIEAVIATVPAAARRTIQPTVKGGQPARFDPLDAEDAVFAIKIFVAARRCSDSLALNEILARLATALENSVESATESLVAFVRSSRGSLGDGDMSRVAVGIEIAGLLFGDEYGAAVRRSIASAAHGAPPQAKAS